MDVHTPAVYEFDNIDQISLALERYGNDDWAYFYYRIIDIFTNPKPRSQEIGNYRYCRNRIVESAEYVTRH